MNIKLCPIPIPWWRHQWKHFPYYWPFVRGIHRSPVNSSHKNQWRGALMFSFICALNKRLSKQSWGWWFETPSRSLWRHCNVTKKTPVVGKIRVPILPAWIHFNPSMDRYSHAQKKKDVGWTTIVEVLEWITSIIPPFMIDVITYPCWD